MARQLGGHDHKPQEGRSRAVGAITATGATGADHRSLCNIMLGVASDAAYEHLEKLMAISYKSQFVEGWYQQGYAVGLAEGIAQGKAKGRARNILRILESRGLSPTRTQRELIQGCTDLDQLDTWFDRSLTATKAGEIFEG